MSLLALPSTYGLFLLMKESLAHAILLITVPNDAAFRVAFRLGGVVMSTDDCARPYIFDSGFLKSNQLLADWFCIAVW